MKLKIDFPLPTPESENQQRESLFSKQFYGVGNGKFNEILSFFRLMYSFSLILFTLSDSICYWPRKFIFDPFHPSVISSHFHSDKAWNLKR